MFWHLFNLNRLLEIAPSLASDAHDEGWYPIHAAALTGDINIVSLIAENCEDFGVSLSVSGRTTYGEEGLRTEAVQIREEELGHPAKTLKIDGAMALHFACLAGCIEVIKYLIEHGADLKGTDDSGRRPLAYFNGEGLDNALEFFCDSVRTRKERKLIYKEGWSSGIGDIVYAL